jgi:AcrR family transcriptional regulator
MPPTARKPTSVRRREIAEAALRVIGERGATALTAASLAREVGLTSGALFRHFASLDAILGAAVDLAIEALEATYPPEALPPLQRLRALALRRIEVVGESPGLAWLLLSDQVFLCVPEPAVARLRAAVGRSRAYLLAALREAIAAGELRAELDAETILPIFTGTVHSLITARGVHREPERGAPRSSPERTVDALFALLRPPLPPPTETET